jgi:hypothetical protein
MLEKQCSFALLPVDMGIELECNSKKTKKMMMMLMISDVVAGMGFRECKQACRLHTRTDGDLEEESER